MLDRLERIFGRFAVPNLSLYIVIGQVFVLLAAMLQAIELEKVALLPVAVVHGQWWRVVTFVFFIVPPAKAWSYVFLAFRWYVFYLMGNALEHYWGAFRYNVYLLLSIALTVAFSFITPGAYVTNEYIIYSVFLAFAFLSPDFELLLVIIPVKVKWLAMIVWALWAVDFATGSLALRLQITASTVTFLAFFGGAIVRTLRHSRRASAARASRVREEAQPRHVCHVCGKTDLTNPEMDFRYCSKCAGDQCYCPEHIHNHAHVVAPESQPAP